MKRALIAALILCAAAPLRADDDAPQRTFPIFHVGGFGDIEWHTSSDGDREGLDLIDLDVFGTVQFSDSWSALGEAVLQRQWKRNEPVTLESDLERLYVEYSRSDLLRLEIGQTQTGIVRWNEREHRSRILQTPIDVPAIARRPQDDGAWPQRMIGLWTSGRMPGSLGVVWGVAVGAGPGRVRDTITLTGNDRSPAGLLSLSFSPDSIPGLEVGAAAYAQHIRSEPDRIRERDVTLSVNYVSSGNELRAEWARMKHRLTSQSTTYVSTGYYILASKRLSGRYERIRPYLMLDRVTIDHREAYLADAKDESAWSAGVRFDVTQRFTIKGEYRSQRSVTGDREDLLGIQLGLSF